METKLQKTARPIFVALVCGANGAFHVFLAYVCVEGAIQVSTTEPTPIASALNEVFPEWHLLLTLLAVAGSLYSTIVVMLCLIGAFVALRRRKWPLALTGSIAACVSMAFISFALVAGNGTSGLFALLLLPVGITALVFTVRAKMEFA